MRDVAVVGGGPAGLAVALAARRAGLTVTVVERRDGELDKACGEGLMPGALRALHQLGLDPPGAPITGITYRQDGRSVTATFRNGPGRGVRRTVLHATLRDAASAAGVELRAGTVERVLPRPDHVLVDGTPARYAVAADGLHSPVRTQLGLERGAGRRPRWGLRQHFAVTPWTDRVEVTWAADSECYVTPVGPDVVGVAVLSSTRGGFAEQLAAFPDVAARVHDAVPVSRVRGAGPLRQRVRARAAGRVLLVGDAAGYVDALTGEGLAVAFVTAPRLVECLLRDRPQDYEREWARATRRSRALTAGLLWARGRPGLGRHVVPLAATVPPLFAAAVEQLAR